MDSVSGASLLENRKRDDVDMLEYKELFIWKQGVFLAHSHLCFSLTISFPPYVIPQLLKLLNFISSFPWNRLLFGGQGGHGKNLKLLTATCVLLWILHGYLSLSLSLSLLFFWKSGVFFLAELNKNMQDFKVHRMLQDIHVTIKYLVPLTNMSIWEECVKSPEQGQIFPIINVLDF